MADFGKLAAFREIIMAVSCHALERITVQKQIADGKQREVEQSNCEQDLQDESHRRAHPFTLVCSDSACSAPPMRPCKAA